MDENKGRDTEEALKSDPKEQSCPDDRVENDGVKVNRSKNSFELDIDKLIREISEKFNDRCPLSWMRENSGSHYSGVRQADRDEFDFMFYPTIVQCRIKPCDDHPCYCRVYITNKHDLPLEFQEILKPDDELIPSKFREYVFPVFDKIITEHVLVEKNEFLKRVDNENFCPAYTFEYVTKIRADNFNTYSDSQIVKNIDLVPCLRIQDPPPFCMEWETKKLTEEEKRSCPIYVVPKKLPAADDEELELWRISYSAFEQKIILDKCDWVEKNVIRNLKDCLRYKRIEDKKNKLCSYHITTNCLHFFEKIEKRPKRGMDYIMLAADSMIAALKAKDIPHFFMRDFNLLHDVDIKECEYFIWKLDCHRKGIPID